VVVFFPSFKYADEVYTRWVKTNAMGQLSKHKSVFREPRTAAKVEKVLRDFAVRNGAGAVGRCTLNQVHP
jgi:chromosome transmission fidelity protein 1